jgi:hypothetical protein
MTVMFQRYFGVPQSVIRDGLWQQMKSSEQSLYVALLHESERYRTRKLSRTDSQLRELSGLSARSFPAARSGLQKHGLVLCELDSKNVYSYTICNPETRQPWAGDPKEIIPYRKAQAQQQSDEARPVVVKLPEYEPEVLTAPEPTKSLKHELESHGGLPLKFGR